MRRLGIAWALVLLLVGPSWAMERYINVVQDRLGNALPGTRITVYVAGSTVLADLFSDQAGAVPKANPFTNEGNGAYDFFAANGPYDIRFSRSGTDFSTAHATYNNVLLFDVDDSGIATGTVGLDANFDTTNGNVITGSSEGKRFELFGTGPQAGKAWVMYVHSDGSFRLTCMVDGLEEDCNKEIKLLTGRSFIVRNNASQAIMTLTEAGLLSGFIVKEEDWFEVAGCDNATAALIFNTPTANAPAAVCEGSNTRIATADFDASTDESFHGRWRLPTGFQPSLGIDVTFRWKAASTSGATGWCFQMVRIPVGNTSDPALPAQASGNCVSDTAAGTTLQENEATITNVTCTSCVAGDAVAWRLSRDADGSAVTDGMTGAAKLIQFGRVLRVQK